MRYVITIDRALLDSEPDNPRVIRVEDTRTGEVTHHAEVALHTSATARSVPIVRYGARRQDGARVWIEAEAVEPL